MQFFICPCIDARKKYSKSNDGINDEFNNSPVGFVSSYSSLLEYIFGEICIKNRDFSKE